MKKLGFNPYLPSWEYIPDGEPHVFGDRVYIYGSHDRFNGYEFCANDYVCYSAPIKDLADWRYEGVIYGRCDDPRNQNGEQCLYAPDVTQGPDGRYYLYYCLNATSAVGVAVCDSPAGRYEYYGEVHYPDGTILGDREGDGPQFDPGVLTEGEQTYLYTGFAPVGMKACQGAKCTVLGPDMLTVEEAPRLVVPGPCYVEGTGFEGHGFFEASSIRKVGDTYYFVYSSEWNHEMCYATSKSPTEGFTYRGVIVSNIDMGIGGYKEPEQPMGYRDNNHGGFEYIDGRYYMFYHRHTNNYSFSRQACLEPIEILADGSIPQVGVTSCGPNGGPLPGKGYYPAYICCNLYRQVENPAGAMFPGCKRDPRYPYLTQEGKDGDENPGYIENIMDGAVWGFKYFACENSRISQVQMRVAAAYGPTVVLEVALTPYGEAIGSIDVKEGHDFKDGWGYYPADICLPDGTQAIFFRLKGMGKIAFGGFELK